MVASWDAAAAVQGRSAADAREAAGSADSMSAGAISGTSSGNRASSTLSHSLFFDSDFESGNLLRAVQVGPTEYDLVLRTDVHTTSYTQWFYFAVSNTHLDIDEDKNGPSRRYRFNIVNLAKPDSLFNQVRSRAAPLLPSPLTLY